MEADAERTSIKYSVQKNKIFKKRFTLTGRIKYAYEGGAKIEFKHTENVINWKQEVKWIDNNGCVKKWPWGIQESSEKGGHNEDVTVYNPTLEVKNNNKYINLI